MNHLKTRRGLIIIVVVAFIVGTLWASNMGFLLNCTLYAPTPGISATGTNTVNIPYQHTGLATAHDLMIDIDPTIGSVLNVQAYLEASSTLSVYTGRKNGGLNFPIVPGDCYFVRMRNTTDYVLDGSHVPGLALSLDAAGPGHADGTNFVALPYHACAQNAKQLMDDIGFSSVISVQRYIAATDTLQSYTGRKASGPAFPLSPCECYFIKMSSTVQYIPSHY
jgi:hypothetical protein